jgi:hypothetical protein
MVKNRMILDKLKKLKNRPTIQRYKKTELKK